MRSNRAASIRIDLGRTLGGVDPRIYGGFIEHVGRCMYGGVFDEGSALSDEQGFRRDVLDAMCELGITCLRWPGGLFANGYHWLDGIGPRDARPRRLDLAWRAEETNRFGTDEFIRYCRRVGAEPVVCVNLATGSLDEAAAWVEYCNGTGDTYWANRRRQNGSDEPHAVKYWCLGNEAYNRMAIGTLSAEEYVKRAIEFAKVMKMADSSIRLISSGLNGWSRWDRIVLEGLAPWIHLHSIHLYTGSDDYYSNVLAPHQAERALRICQGLIDGVRYHQGIGHPIHIAYDEWGIWFRAGDPPWDDWTDIDSALEERYTLADALAVATYLNTFVRQCRTVRMANIAQLVNVLAPIVTDARGLVRQTTFHALHLFSENLRGEAVDAWVQSDLLDFGPEDEVTPWPHRVGDLGPFAALDVAAVRTSDGAAFAVINRDVRKDISATIEVVGASTMVGFAYELNAPDVGCSNWFGSPDEVTVVRRDVEVSGGALTHVFPAHSLTVLNLINR